MLRYQAEKTLATHHKDSFNIIIIIIIFIITLINGDFHVNKIYFDNIYHRQKII